MSPATVQLLCFFGSIGQSLLLSLQSLQGSFLWPITSTDHLCAPAGLADCLYWFSYWLKCNTVLNTDTGTDDALFY